jgi:redox-sensitive bicupin YhaK (pirin superfamily)
VHVARGQIELNGTSLAAGDAALISEPAALELVGLADEQVSEFLVFDLA